MSLGACRQDVSQSLVGHDHLRERGTRQTARGHEAAGAQTRGARAQRHAPATRVGQDACALGGEEGRAEAHARQQGHGGAPHGEAQRRAGGETGGARGEREEDPPPEVELAPLLGHALAAVGGPPGRHREGENELRRSDEAPRAADERGTDVRERGAGTGEGTGTTRLRHQRHAAQAEGDRRGDRHDEDAREIEGDDDCGGEEDTRTEAVVDDAQEHLLPEDGQQQTR